MLSAALAAWAAREAANKVLVALSSHLYVRANRWAASQHSAARHRHLANNGHHCCSGCCCSHTVWHPAFSESSWQALDAERSATRIRTFNTRQQQHGCRLVLRSIEQPLVVGGAGSKWH